MIRQITYATTFGDNDIGVQNYRISTQFRPRAIKITTIFFPCGNIVFRNGVSLRIKQSSVLPFAEAGRFLYRISAQLMEKRKLKRIKVQKRNCCVSKTVLRVLRQVKRNATFYLFQFPLFNCSRLSQVNFYATEFSINIFLINVTETLYLVVKFSFDLRSVVQTGILFP